MAAHLAGAFAGSSTLPVIGIPMKGGAVDGLDALLATVHGNSFRRIREKPQLKRIMEEKMFERILFLQGGEPGKGMTVYDSRGQVMTR